MWVCALPALFPEAGEAWDRRLQGKRREIYDRSRRTEETFLNWKIIALQWRCLVIEPIIRTFLALVLLLFLRFSRLPILLYSTPTSSYIHNCLLKFDRCFPLQLDNTWHSWHSKMLKGFPGGPVAKTLCSQYKEPRFDPWSGNWIPHAATKCLHVATESSQATAERFHVPQLRACVTKERFFKNTYWYPSSRWMDKKAVVHIHNGVLLSH